jgi:PTS system nitrogen regulatory IIA component
MSTETLMGIKEVAAYLKINQATAYHWAQAGRLPGIKIGRIWRFRREDIDTWLDESMHRPRPASGSVDSLEAGHSDKP